MPPTAKRRRNAIPQYILDMRHVLNNPPSESEPESQKTMRRYKDESLPKFLAMLRAEEAAFKASKGKRVRKVDAGSERCLQILRDLLAEVKEKIDGPHASQPDPGVHLDVAES